MNLTHADLNEWIKAFERLPKEACGIVCRPQFHDWCVNNLSPCPEREAFGLGGIPVYVVMNQAEDYRMFYDRMELLQYLADDERKTEARLALLR